MSAETTASRCPRCQAQTNPGGKFCESCGAPLQLICAACGHRAAATARYCAACGQPLTEERPSSPARRPYTPRHLAERILTSRSALEGERKQVTVLFADIKGSMELQEDLDPEDWHRIMDRFFQILADGVHRFEGTVNQYTGDGIMALFGAPIAHEDHGQRACYAALHLRDELRRYANELRLRHGLSFSVRMGMNSGEVVVGRIGDDFRMDYTAQGHTVGLAARMQQIAEPGRVYLTGRTQAIIAAYFHLEDLGEFRVKGVRDPVPVYALEEVGKHRTRLDVSRARGFSRFVGRAAEMEQLEAALEQVVAGGGRVVGIVASPGTGKSRLCYEFAERCRVRGLPVYETQGLAHAKSVPLLPVLGLWRAYFGITDRDSDRGARDKIAGRVLVLDPALADALPLIHDFLGVPDPAIAPPRLDPQARQLRLQEVVRRLSGARSEREAAVFIIEDLHWLDEASERFVESQIEAIAGTRTLLVVNYRPEYRPRWLSLPWCGQVALPHLGPEATDELLHDLLGKHASVVDLAALIRKRTSGNPFFIEEIVRTLVETGRITGSRGGYELGGRMKRLVVPTTVQAVLAARIDRLPDPSKRILQAAAVIGKRFPVPLLARIAEVSEDALGAILQDLVDAELFREEALYPEAEYSFKHRLTQEVALQSQLADKRARVHAAVARALGELHPESRAERSALLALHWDAAGDAERAAHWHQRAAERALATHSSEAHRHWKRARELLDTLPVSPEVLAQSAGVRSQLIMQAVRLGSAEDEIAPLVREGRDLAERSGDRRALALLLNCAGFYQMYAGDPAGGIELLEQAKEHADQTEDIGLRTWTRSGMTVGYTTLGQLRTALERSEEALDISRDDPGAGIDIAGYSARAFTSSIRGWVLTAAGELTRAARELDAAIDGARRGGELIPWAVANAAYTHLCECTGDAAGGLAHARAAAELAERVGNEAVRVWGYWALGLAYALDEQWSPSRDMLNVALGIARQRRTQLQFEAQILARLAVAEAMLGGHERALALADESLAIVAQRQTALFEVDACAARALARSAGPDAADVARAEIDAAVALAQRLGARGRLAHLHLVRAEIEGFLGDAPGRQRALLEAQRLRAELLGGE